jgi:hypothetical protein
MAIGLGNLDKKATSLFASSDGNFKKFEKSLRDSGVAAVDAALITKKYQTELMAARKAALGLGDAEAKRAKEVAKAEAAMAAATVKAEKERQKAIEKTRQEQEKAMKASLGYQMKSAFKEAINPRQMAIGFARGVGEGALGAPGAMMGGALNLATRVTDMISNVGGSFATAVIDAAQFRQNAITGLEYMLGSKEEAVSIFKQAQDLAKKTPLDTHKVLEGVQQLATAGFSGQESMELFKVVADQAAKFSLDTGMQGKVIEAFSRIKGRGVAMGEDLGSLRLAGFNEEKITQALLEDPNLAPLFKKVKISGLAGGKTKFVDQSKADQLSILKQVKEILGEGRVGVYDLLNATVKSVEKESGKGVGEFAAKMGGESLTGTISNVKSAFTDLLESTAVDKWSGVEALQKFLTKISENLDPKKANAFLGTMEKLTDAIFGGLGKITDADIQGFLQTISLMAEKLIGFLKEAWGWFDKLIHAEPGAFLDAVGDVLIDAGKLIGKGILEGVGSAVNPFDTSDTKKFIGKHGVSKDIMSDLAERHGEKDMTKFAARFDVQRKAFSEAGGLTAMEAGLGRALDPDELADAIARFAATRGQGLSGDVPKINIPEMAVGGIVTGPTLALIGEAGPEAVVPLSGTKGRDYSLGLSGQGSGRGDVAVYVNVTGGADPEMTGQVIGREVRRELTRLFERTALEG